MMQTMTIPSMPVHGAAHCPIAILATESTRLSRRASGLIREIENLCDDHTTVDPDALVEEIDVLVARIDKLVSGITSHRSVFVGVGGEALLDQVLGQVGGARLANAHQALDGIRTAIGLATLH
jgi:hypothetical protein